DGEVPRGEEKSSSLGLLLNPLGQNDPSFKSLKRRVCRPVSTRKCRRVLRPRYPAPAVRAEEGLLRAKNRRDHFLKRRSARRCGLYDNARLATIVRWINQPWVRTSMEFFVPEGRPVSGSRLSSRESQTR